MLLGSVKVWDPRQKDKPVANMTPAEGEEGRDCWCVAFGKTTIMVFSFSYLHYVYDAPRNPADATLSRQAPLAHSKHILELLVQRASWNSSFFSLALACEFYIGQV